MKKILLISPHPDDIEIWMGATAARLVSENNAVRSIIITDGRRSPRSIPITDAEMASIRAQESQAAHQALGITDIQQYSLPSIADETIVRAIIQKELDKNFDEIYLPHPHDGHKTHARIADLVLEAAGTHPTPAVLWAYDGWNFLHNPTRYEEISAYLSQKLDAIRCHKSQIADKAYDEAMEKFARVRALLMSSHTVTNAQYIEAFTQLDAQAYRKNCI